MKISLTARERELLSRALNLAKQHRRLESEIIEALIEIDQRRCYRKLGCPSLFVYAVNILDLSEPVAYTFITVARKSAEIPQLNESIRAQSLTVAKASRIVSALTSENAAELLEFARTHTTRETDREAARINPKRRKSKLQPASRELLKRAQSLLSSRMKKPVDSEEALVIVLTEYIDRHDPVKKAERAVRRKTRKAQNAPAQADEAKKPTQPFKRITLKAAEKHAVNLTDQGRCVFVDASGKRCPNDCWIHTHHVIEVQHGGTNDPENLRSLCAEHHAMVHQLSFPAEGFANRVQERHVPCGA